MNKELINLFVFIGICFIGYLLFRNLNYKEGMSSDASGNNSSSSGSSGIAGNASAYAATIKSNVIKNQDVLLISKYRSDYETTILNLDDLVNNLMLTTALNIDPSKPLDGLDKLNKLNESKVALNNVMKFIDASH
uniref:Uncharacterized protein n=1 Tax=viral metagenome TaxID=1070528 RepID=A0A6C0ERQ4_9ZZZZ